MENAIKKAIEGGYKDGHVHGFREVLLDPEFWSALGKQQSWGLGNKCPVCEEGILLTKYMPHWKMNLHRFIDHIAEGKDVDSFFNHLLK